MFELGQEPETPPPLVLVVDDDDATRSAIVSMISAFGVNPLEASSGRQALNVMKKHRIDLVISDLVMPKMSGMMLLHSMLEQGLHVPFILTTGYGDKDAAIQALRLGAFDFLEKPFVDVDLQSVVHEALQVSRAQRRLEEKLSAEGSPLGIELNPRAELQIMKMRTLRFRGQAETEGEGDTAPRDWENLKTLFVQEAEPQLIFCEAAFQAIERGEMREAGFVLRVMQSVRMASEAIRVNDVAELAWSLEKALAAVKGRPAAPGAEVMRALRRALTALATRVRALGDAEATQAKKDLDRLVG